MKIQLSVFALFLLVTSSGCSVKNGLEIGPIEMTLPVGSGSLDPAQFPETSLPYAIGSVEQDFCDLPTEDEVTGVFRTGGNIDVSSVVTLSRLELKKTVLHANAGALRNIQGVQLFFVPASGSIFQTINLGGAVSLTGFDDTIELKPPKNVDLLDIIKENDKIGGDNCPKIVVKAAGSVPDEPITWDAELQVDGYARLGFSW